MLLEASLCPGELNILCGAIERHCAMQGIQDKPGREHIAILALQLYRSGATTAKEIEALLANSSGRPLSS
jgi:hypothetical protein